MCIQRASFLSRSAVLIGILVCWPHITAAQRGGFDPRSPGQPAVDPQTGQAEPRRPAPTGEKYTLLTYEVDDLVLNIQDHPYSESLDPAPNNVGGGMGSGMMGGGYGGGGGGMGYGGAGGGEMAPRLGITKDAAPTSITIGELCDVIASTVAASTWATNGGEGQIRPLGTALVVWQAPTIHEQIKNLLDQLRQGSGERKTVTIDARWLLLDSDDLDRLILPDQEGVPKVDRKLLADLTRKPGNIRGITNCFSGQSVYLVSGTRRNVVSSYIPVVGSLETGSQGARLVSGKGRSLMRLVSEQSLVERDRSVGYQAIVEKPNFGALLEIRPTLMRDGDTAIVDLKSTLTVSAEQADGADLNSMPAPLAPAVDRIAIETQELATTLRMPLGDPVLVGGLTYVPASPQTSETGGEARGEAVAGETGESAQLYLVLEVR